MKCWQLDVDVVSAIEADSYLWARVGARPTMAAAARRNAELLRAKCPWPGAPSAWCLTPAEAEAEARAEAEAEARALWLASIAGPPSRAVELFPPLPRAPYRR